MRLALFPLIFNLSFAQELEVDTDESSSRKSESEVNNSETPIDSSLNVQNFEEDTEESHPNPLLLGEERYEIVGEVDEQDTQDFSLDVKKNISQSVDSSPSVQNDSNTENDEEELEDEKISELIISEVYYDGTDEWIEIYNIGNKDFSWNIELSWARTKTQIYENIQIPANNFLIIANSDEMFEFSWDVNIILNTWNYKKFSIADTKEIQIFLILSWEIVDDFYAHEYRVKHRNDEKISFQKVISQGRFVVTWSYLSEDEDRQNISPWFWVVAKQWVFIETTEKAKDYSKDPNSEPEDIPQADCSDAEEDIMTIDEVFRWWSRYNPYIEFSIHEDIEYEYTHLILSWSLLSQPITIDLDEETETYDQEKLQKNTKLILTTNAWSLTEAGPITIVLHPDLSFNSFSWELELYGITRQSRQLLDIVKITTWSLEKSTYTNGFNHRCGITMDNVMDFSPGFDESALKYFPWHRHITKR